MIKAFLICTISEFCHCKCLFWEMVLFTSRTNRRATRNVDLFILVLAIVLLLIRIKIQVNTSLFPEQAQVVFNATS